MGFKYLSKSVIAGFDKYKYCSIDNSPISLYISHPFWNWLVKFYPMWFAPNAITLIGFLLLVLEFAVLTYYDCNFFASDDSHPEYAPVPNWVWLLSTLCMFGAHTLDGTDGKQARRTGTSSPLGELFDHGLDSWVTLFMPLGMYSVFGRGDFSLPPDRAFYVFAGVMITFVITHWEKYTTGILFLPWGYDLSQFGMALVYVITFFGGYSVWKFTLPFTNVSAGLMFEIIMHVSVFGISIPMSLWNVFVAYRDNAGTRKKSSFPNLSFYESMRALFPSAILFTLFTTWMFKSSINIMFVAPRLFISAMGVAFSNSTCRLIVSCMSCTRCEAFNWLLIPLIGIVGAVCTMNLGVIELYLLWSYAIFATAAHLHYGACVVQQLADHLNIYVFSVQKRPLKKS